ncbi:hypothetical protein D3C76_1288540 [compost metagenome]
MQLGVDALAVAVVLRPDIDDDVHVAARIRLTVLCGQRRAVAVDHGWAYGVVRVEEQIAFVAGQGGFAIAVVHEQLATSGQLFLYRRPLGAPLGFADLLDNRVESWDAFVIRFEQEGSRELFFALLVSFGGEDVRERNAGVCESVFHVESSVSV